MKTFLLSVLIIVVLIAALSRSSYSKKKDEPDYSNYEIAKQNLKNGDLVLAYKNLIIFKFVNITRLRKSENTAVLGKIDSQINQLEDLLIKATSVTHSSGTGFGNKSTDVKKVDYKTISLAIPEIN